MFADDAIYLVLWSVKGLRLRDYNFIMLPKKRLVIGTKTSTQKKRKKMYKDIQAWAMPATILPVYIKRKVYVHPSVSQFVMLNVLAS